MQDITVLLSGIDSLNLAIDIVWLAPGFLDTLRPLLEQAKESKEPVPYLLPEADGQGTIPFMVQPHGKRGYTWLLLGADYSLRIMDWVAPRSRPSIMAELRSELLWRLGPVEAAQRLLAALEAQGGLLLKVKPSRVDLCMDVLAPANDWTADLRGNVASQATKSAAHYVHDELTGITFGKGEVSARLYDKAREIREASGKTWFHDLWRLHEVPEDQRVIRIEFQLRREALRELGMNDLGALFRGIEHLWAYCTGKWLKFQDRPGLHHTQRRVLPWWRTVQDSFLGIGCGEPLIRAKAIESDKRRLRQQVTGLCSSLIALDHDKAEPQPVRLRDYPLAARDAVINLGKTPADLRDDVARKLARKARLRRKLAEAANQRQRLGLEEGKS